MDDLPELPFEKVLSYLSLEDRLKARAVSRRWYHQINRFKVKTLCYSQRSAGFIEGKRRWVSGAFAKNFISSTRFDFFVNTFAPTILSRLKHLRLCDLRLNQDMRKLFVRTLESFDQLEELDIVGLTNDGYHLGIDLELPMLSSIRIESVEKIEYVNLEAPRLLKVKLLCNTADLQVDIVHGESVERLVAECLRGVPVKRLKNLKYLYVSRSTEIDSTFLSGLEQLKEIHLQDSDYDISELFEQKRRYGRSDLKIYHFGLLLDSPDDPAIECLVDEFEEDSVVHLAENLSRLADEIPTCIQLNYTTIECAPPGAEIEVAKRFTDLSMMRVEEPVQDTQRFLNLLKNCDLVDLDFDSDQPQDLFDRLPEHCSAIQRLAFLDSTPSDSQFLLRLKELTSLWISYNIELELVRKIFEELKFLFYFEFKYLNKKFQFERSERSPSSNWTVWIGKVKRPISDLNATIQFIEETTEEDE